MLGLVASQLLPGALGTAFPGFKATTDTLLYVCLGFIMINVGREFEIDKSRWRSYTADYFIAMATAALPWLLIVLYYIFVLLPSDLWTDSEAWKENLLLSRFAAPTSAGILFTMLAALSLKKSWIYRKIQVLAIFDDLDTILLMIPLQILMIGLKWQMFAIVGVVVVLLVVGWRWQATWNVRQCNIRHPCPLDYALVGVVANSGPCASGFCQKNKIIPAQLQRVKQCLIIQYGFNIITVIIHVCINNIAALFCRQQHLFFHVIRPCFSLPSCSCTMILRKDYPHHVWIFVIHTFNPICPSRIICATT